MLFNLYVADLQDILPPTVKSFQYADDTTLYTSCSTPQITSQAESMNATLAGLGAWSNDSNLALNSKKTKAILISTPQMAHVHSLGNLELGLEISDDTRLFIAFRSGNDMEEFAALAAMESCIADFSQWMQTDKLKLNADKTEFVLIGARQQLQKVSNISILSVGDSKIASSFEVRNLGIWFDSKMKELLSKDKVSVTCIKRGLRISYFYQLGKLPGIGCCPRKNCSLCKTKLVIFNQQSPLQPKITIRKHCRGFVYWIQPELMTQKPSRTVGTDDQRDSSKATRSREEQRAQLAQRPQRGSGHRGPYQKNGGRVDKEGKGQSGQRKLKIQWPQMNSGHRETEAQKKRGTLAERNREEKGVERKRRRERLIIPLVTSQC
ncbi:hypothetical protein AWC38_SpisGene14693 [Stylophora pistillata]|uniref:Reverse transcriptase domain-containing protein n=1 Tax=Stylophora pistillata TaxID=50429 RepID=A0A2B4RX55_STYPI|nr:hypothetical protein AWC38_SpisGene14693 [Stylophora pistillata]